MPATRECSEISASQADCGPSCDIRQPDWWLPQESAQKFLLADALLAVLLVQTVSAHSDLRAARFFNTNFQLDVFVHNALRSAFRICNGIFWSTR